MVVDLSEHFEWFHEKSALKQKIGANLAKQRLMLLVRMLLRFIPWFITASVILLSKVYFKNPENLLFLMYILDYQHHALNS